MNTLIWKEELFFLYYLEQRKTIASFQEEAASLDDYINQEAQNMAAVFSSFCEAKLAYFEIDPKALQEELKAVISEIVSVLPIFIDRPNPLFFLFYDSCYHFCLEYLDETLQQKRVDTGDLALEDWSFPIIHMNNQENRNQNRL